MSSSSRSAPTLNGIMIYKFLRGVLLLMLAMRVYALVGQDLRPHFDAALAKLRVDPESDFFERLGQQIDRISPVNVSWAATGALLYGTLSILEGVGLARRWRWAGWLVVVESGFFVPLETYGLLKKPSISILIVLILNVAIVVYVHRNRHRLFG